MEPSQEDKPVKFYFPKVKYEFLKKNNTTSKEYNLLDDYIFVFHAYFFTAI